MITFAVDSVPRSFDSLCSLRMTTAFKDFHLYMLIKADNHNYNLQFLARKDPGFGSEAGIFLSAVFQLLLVVLEGVEAVITALLRQ